MAVMITISGKNGSEWVDRMKRTFAHVFLACESIDSMGCFGRMWGRSDYTRVKPLSGGSCMRSAEIAPHQIAVRGPNAAYN